MASFDVDIKMSQETVNALSQNGFILYGFKAVKSAIPGAPVVWFQTRAYGKDTVLNWDENYEAYTSTSDIVAGGRIKATNSYPIKLGQTLEVNDRSGTGSVSGTGKAGAISIMNNTSTKLTCGISQLDPDGAVSPMCAFPLFGNNLDVIAPIERILLMFSTSPFNTGTVIFQAYSPGVLIDLTGATSRDLSYDIDNGWAWDGGAWGRQIKASENLVPLLIENAAQLSQLPRVSQAKPLPEPLERRASLVGAPNGHTA